MRMNHGDTEEMLRIRRTTGTLQTFDNDNLKKAVAAGLACLSLAYVLQNPPAFIASYLDEVEVNMTRTTAEYPSSFASPDEYDERCDTNSLRFMLNNVESLKASGFTFTRWGTPADMFNILADLLKTMSAVLMQPVASIPNADEFRVHEVHRTDLSLRRSPTNHFVTLGSLVPPPDMLWRHNGRFDWLPTDEAQGLIDLVHRNLPDGVRAVGSEFDPVQSVNQLMRGPHQPNRMVMMPWTVQTALLFFPIQFTQLVWELSAESFFRVPFLMTVLQDTSMLQAWFRLSFRYEILLPALLRLLRCYITVDNLRSWFRGDPQSEAWRLRLALVLLLVLVSLPQLLVYLPAALVTLSIATPPTFLLCWGCKRWLDANLWPTPYYAHFPSLLVAFPVNVVTAFLVNKLFHPLSAETYICTFAKATLVPVGAGIVTLDAPIIFFIMSMLCCAMAVAVPVWMLKHLAPPNVVAHMLSPEYLYMQWLKSPLYNAMALRTDEHDYRMHKIRHFFLNNSHPLRCKYCAHLQEDKKMRQMEENVPKQAVLFRGRRMPWEPPCLLWFASEAQRGGNCASELRLAIYLMQRSKQPEEFHSTLHIAYRFAEGLQHAEAMRHALQAPSGSVFFYEDRLEATHVARLMLVGLQIYVPIEKELPHPVLVHGMVDGTNRSLLRSLRAFLFRHGELDYLSVCGTRQRSFPPVPRRERDSPLDPVLAEAMQRYLKKESFFRDAADGDFGENSIRALQAWLAHEGFAFERWLRDDDGVWGTATVIALQKFLKKEEAGPSWKAHAVDGNFHRECCKLLEDFLFEQNVLTGTYSLRWGSKGQQALKHYLRKCGYSNEDCGVRSCSVCARWLKGRLPFAQQSHQSTTRIGGESGFREQEPFGPLDPTSDAYEDDLLRVSDWTAAMQAWLRDEGFVVGVKFDNLGAFTSYEEAGVDGIWAETTTMALQQFLNSSRSTVAVTSTILTVNAEWASPTVTRMCEFLVGTGASPELLCEGAWESIGRGAMQQFLKDRGFYAGNVDGGFESLSVEALKAWLESEGYVVKGDDEDGVAGQWSKATTKALQMFLNSAKAFYTIFHIPLDENGEFGPHTQSALKGFLTRAGENCGIGGGVRSEEDTDVWGRHTRYALQSFLTKHNFGSGDARSGSVSYELEAALQGWLKAHGFEMEAPPVDSKFYIDGSAKHERDRANSNTSPAARGDRFMSSGVMSSGFNFGSLEDVVTDFGYSTTLALQRFLNSEAAKGVGDSKLHEGLCWSLALFGGVDETDLPPGALETVRKIQTPEHLVDYVDKTRKANLARLELRKSTMKSKDAWWGIGELLRCLGDEVWLHSVGTTAARAAFGALKCLTRAEEAHEGTVDAAVAQLIGHCRSASAGVLQVAGETLAAHAREEGGDEVARVALQVLMKRLVEPEAANMACMAIEAFGPLAHEPLLEFQRDLKSEDGGVLMRAAMAIGTLCRRGVLEKEVADRAADELTRRLTPQAVLDQDWSMTVFALRGLAKLGGDAAAKHQRVVATLLDNEEGLIVAAAGEVLGALNAAHKLAPDVVRDVVSRLAKRLFGDTDRYIEVGVCQCLGALGKAATPVVHLLMERLKGGDIEIIRAAGTALAKLQESQAVSKELLEAAADEAAARLSAPNWELRLGACAVLGTLGAVGMRGESALRKCLDDDDEAALVRAQAREALAKMRLQLQGGKDKSSQPLSPPMSPVQEGKSSQGSRSVGF